MKLAYTRYFQCQVENTLTIALILRALCGYSVDNLPTSLWIKMWEIRQVSWCQDLRVEA